LLSVSVAAAAWAQPGAAPAPAAAPAAPAAKPAAAAAAPRGPAAPSPFLLPGDNLVVEGVPPIPRELAERVSRYTEFRGAGLPDWHPRRREMLISTRFGDTNQVHRVLMPGGARTQLTFFPDRVSGSVYEPTQGDFFIFHKDIGGGEWF